MAEELPKPQSEEAPKKEFDTNELLDIAGVETATEIPEPQKEAERPEPQPTDPEPPREPQPEPERKEPPEEVPQHVQVKQEAPVESVQTEKEKELAERLKWYELLYGNEQPAEPYAAQPNVQPQQVQQQPVQQEQPKSWFDNVTVKQDELYDLLSGDPARAAPVLKKFVALSVVGAMHHMKEEQIKAERTTRYIGACQEALYSKYEDLKNFTPVVKMAGDQIEQEYRAKGIARYPHQLVDEIGIRARNILKQISEQRNGSTTPVAPRKVITQGESGGNRITPPAKEKLSDQQKQMFDLMEE